MLLKRFASLINSSEFIRLVTNLFFKTIIACVKLRVAVATGDKRNSLANYNSTCKQIIICARLGLKGKTDTNYIQWDLVYVWIKQHGY